MRIVVLDGSTLNPGDLSWDKLRALGSCRIFDHTPPERLVARAAKAEVVLTNKTRLHRAVIAQLPRLRYVGDFDRHGWWASPPSVSDRPRESSLHGKARIDGLVGTFSPAIVN